MLSGKCRPCRVDADAALPVAFRAGCGLVEGSALCATGRDRVAADAGQVCRNIRDFLVGQARRLRRHRRVLARAVTIALQGDLQVAGFLATQLGDAVGRVGVAVTLDAVTSKTGVSEFLTRSSIALGNSGLRK